MVYAELISAFEQRGKSQLWPEEACAIYNPGGKVEVGRELWVDYYFWGSTTRLPYRITELEPDFKLSYAAREGHPFVGGATIYIHPHTHGSELEWEGSYKPRSFSLAPFFFRWVFEDKFFGRLKANLNRSYKPKA